MLPRRKLVFAVFGSSNTGTLSWASQLGGAIVHAGHVLLTGSDGVIPPGGSTAVKEAAIAGADAARAAGIRAHWIGVARSASIGFASARSGNARVLHTDLDHRRNCLEACLCDGAVAIAEGDGTASEAAFCLALGKPVLFVGDGWGKHGIKGTPPFKFAALATAGFTRVNGIGSADTPLDHLFNEARVLHQLTSPGPHDWVSTAAAGGAGFAAGAVNWLQNRFSLNTMGEFPPIGRYSAVKAQYEAWIAAL